ncbi:hypothetical protein C8R46DRAFT_1191963 [Mycena filopes]|nr:hypothetical protein C8R46DRAFT_1191963 [Mycena filopes]
MLQDHEYQPLIDDTPREAEAGAPPAKDTWMARFPRSFLVALLAAETLGLVMVLAGLFARPSQAACSAPSPSLYSPALGAVEYEVQVYDLGVPVPVLSWVYCLFQIPPSPKLDKMWSDLYNFGISRITKEEASKLPNKTHALPGDDGYYIAELDVFHTLHCLNKIRMALDPDYYPDSRISTTNNWIPSQENATQHVSHCVDWIRRSIMCSSDTSVIVWQWDERQNASVVKGKVAHTCRKFDKLKAWAEDRMLLGAYDPTVHIEDDIVVPVLSPEFPSE